VSERYPVRPDWALILALQHWGDRPRLLPRFAEPWLARLTASGAEEHSAESPLDRLRDAHRSEMRADLSRVHPSWWVRALQGESSTVRRAVASNVPESIRERLRGELDLRREQLVPEHPPHPAMVACALALWSEPFAGGPPPSGDDPPIVVDLATLPRNELTRLLSMVGLAKLAASSDAAEPAPASARVRARLEHFRVAWAGLPDRLANIAAGEVRRHVSKVLGILPRLGLVSVARL
jgi:hypothetical protein